MSERGSTGASSRYTIRPLSSWRSLLAMDKLTSARTATHARMAMALRIGDFLRHHDGQDEPAHSEQHYAGCQQDSGFHQERDRKSTRLNSSHTVIYTLSLHDALPISTHRRFPSASRRSGRASALRAALRRLPAGLRISPGESHRGGSNNPKRIRAATRSPDPPAPDSRSRIQGGRSSNRPRYRAP